MEQDPTARVRPRMRMFAFMFSPKIFARSDDSYQCLVTETDPSPQTVGAGVVKNDETNKPANVIPTMSRTSANTQAGVREIEAVTKVWSKWDMIAAYVLSVKTSSTRPSTCVEYFGTVVTNTKFAVYGYSSF